MGENWCISFFKDKCIPFLYYSLTGLFWHSWSNISSTLKSISLHFFPNDHSCNQLNSWKNQNIWHAEEDQTARNNIFNPFLVSRVLKDGQKSGFVERLVKASSLIYFSFLFFFFCNIYLFGSARSWLQHLGCLVLAAACKLLVAACEI